MNGLKIQLKEQIMRANDLEEQYVDAKMNWAELDMEVDKLKLKLVQKNKVIQKFSSQVTKLEIGMVQAKQQLAEALNQIHEIETNEVYDNVMVSQNTLGQSLGGKKKGQVRESHNFSDERRSEESGENPVSSDDDEKFNQNISFDDE